MASEQDFYATVLNAGAILTGFCGTFLQFRIQREASYYRQPALSFEKGEARDIYIGLSHFSTSFLLIIVGALLAIVFGLSLPLLALANMFIVEAKTIVAGLLCTMVFLAGYFLAELRHYGILNRRLVNDAEEWGSQKSTAWLTFVAAGVVFCFSWSEKQRCHWLAERSPSSDKSQAGKERHKTYLAESNRPDA